MFEGLFQPMHLILVLAIVLILFGPSKLPELGSSFGKAIKGFKKSMKDIDESINSDDEAKKIDHHSSNNS